MKHKFSPKTKRIIAERAGFHCSLPQCDIITIGPGSKSDETCLTGEASHIYSASQGGPRGFGGLRKEELVSPDNGIWLCETHAKLIDTNRGKKYPAPLLHSWKRLQEAQIAAEQSGRNIPFSWVQGICLHQTKIFVEESALILGKVTLLVGKNDSGKTAICDWLSAISAPSALGRWSRIVRHGNLRFTVTLCNPEEHRIAVTFTSKGINYILDGEPVPFNPIPVKFVFVEIQPRSFGDEQSDLDYIRSHFDVDSIVLQNCAAMLGNQLYHSVQGFSVDETDEPGMVFVDVKGTGKGFHFRQLSGSEQSRVIIEIGMAIAYFYSKYIPTVFVLDLGGTSLDDTGVSTYAEFLLSKDLNFQSIIMSPDPRERVKWAGWEIARLHGVGTGVTIDQEL